MGMLFALTLPGLVVLLVALVALERFGLWVGRSRLPWRRNRPTLSATGFDELTACLYAGKRIELEQHRIELVLRDDAGDAAPPGVVSLGNGITVRTETHLPHHADRR